MKLIIDIPEAEYECAKRRWMKTNDANKMDYYKLQWMKENDAHKMDYYISIGTPLDDVKADVRENVSGEWIDSMEDEDYYCCSNCNCYWTKELVDNCHFDFCPNCGADMRGE